MSAEERISNNNLQFIFARFARKYCTRKQIEKLCTRRFLKEQKPSFGRNNLICIERKFYKLFHFKLITHVMTMERIHLRSCLPSSLLVQLESFCKMYYICLSFLSQKFGLYLWKSILWPSAVPNLKGIICIQLFLAIFRKDFHLFFDQVQCFLRFCAILSDFWQVIYDSFWP